ncbi:MAG: universal stress protein [Anaerolineales bacterium]
MHGHGDQLVPYNTAAEDFRQARRQATLEELLAPLRGRSARLLSFEEVRQQLHAVDGRAAGLQEIPLDAIVGSVGRYTDFTRNFLPRANVNPERWTKINLKTTGLRGLPPIDVYRVGNAYFVKDGNHRVSVARRHRMETIQAYVTEVQTRVPLSPDDQPDDLILKAEYTRFLERVPIDQVRPQASLLVTSPGQYEVLEGHIQAYRRYLSKRRREIGIKEALGAWYDETYMPVAQLIRREGLLRNFPNRTETDLFLWLLEHRQQIEESLGWEVRTDEAMRDLHRRFGHRAAFLRQQAAQWLYDMLVPDPIESGPSPGEWRREKHLEPDSPAEGRLFDALLVPIKGDDQAWQAVAQALVFAQQDGSVLRGLHVVENDYEARLLRPQMLQSAFAQHCDEARVRGELSVVSGDVNREICARARWADLVVMKLSYAPGPRIWRRWRSGFRTLLRRCPRPILAVPQRTSKMEHALLAFDHTPRAREALYVGAYLSAKWGTRLSVLTVDAPLVKGDPQTEARTYLEGLGIQAVYIETQGAIAPTIVRTAHERGCDLLLIGSYNRHPLRELLLGSVLESVLQEIDIPVLICR